MWFKKRKALDNPQQDQQQQQQQTLFKFTPDPRRIMSDVILAFTHDWGVPAKLRDKHPAYLKIDATTSDLTEEEIRRMLLRMSALNDLLLATEYRPSEIDRMGLEILKEDMQAEDLAYLRLKKSTSVNCLKPLST